MKQLKFTLAAVFAASLLMISCGGKKSAADLAKSHCQMLKDAGKDATKLEEASKKIESECKAAAEGMKGDDSVKFVLEYTQAVLKDCGKELMEN